MIVIKPSLFFLYLLLTMKNVTYGKACEFSQKLRKALESEEPFSHTENGFIGLDVIGNLGAYARANDDIIYIMKSDDGNPDNTCYSLKTGSNVRKVALERFHQTVALGINHPEARKTFAGVLRRCCDEWAKSKAKAETCVS
jgi:hypothetical protein